MNKKICVLEDSDDIRELIEIVFSEENFEVVLYANVKDFNDGFRQSAADLFLLDVMLPDGNGLDVCNMIKAEQDTKDTPVIIMTANSGISSMHKKCNAEDFIAKPFDIDDLVKRVGDQMK